MSIFTNVRLILRKVFHMGIQLDSLASNLEALKAAVAAAVPTIAGVPQLQADLAAAKDALAKAQADAVAVAAAAAAADAAAQARIDELTQSVASLTAQLPAHP